MLFGAIPRGWTAPELEFHPPPTATDAATPAIMRDLAERLLPVFQDADSERYLADLSALQMVAGDHTAADVSRQSLRERRRKADAGRPVGRSVIYDMYAHSRAMEAEKRIAFAESFTKSFQEAVSPLSDEDAFAVTAWLATAPPVFQETFQKLLDQQRAADSIGLSEAVNLVWAYLSFDAYRSFGPLIDSLAAEDDRRRYTAATEFFIKTADGANIAIVMIRPKTPPKPLPALLEFTIGDSRNFAKECAAHGYVGVVAYTRGKGGGDRRVVPYQHDGEDARAVINWIAGQSWSDGRVGMYGDRYSGFAAWAAAARQVPALKAIATSGASAPGIDFPMAGSVFQNFAYRWSLHVTAPHAAPDDRYADDALWSALDQKWYRSGRRYRDLGRLNGQPDPIFIRWLNHPSYDRYWQKMVPYREQFAHINIPVLSITGYFAASEPAALYYFIQHSRYDPHADHTLVIGPYDDGGMQRAPAAELHGYQVDSTALVDLHQLRFRWFDHILKGGATPSLLAGRINYEVMGANEWRHAPSLEAMARGSLKFYLAASASAGDYRLTRRKSSNAAFVQQTVSFVDRSDAGWTPPTELISKSLVAHNSLTFVSEPLTKPIELNGLLSGRLLFTVNKQDMDLNLMLYELQAGGSYVRLFNPTYEFRASYVRDRVHRHLLKAGEHEELVFRSERITSRQVQSGSRLVMVLGINKRPDREINYGTGNDVSEESIAEGRIPLKVRWYGGSYIEIPVR
jgi:putative CocE/NonD family hydrolase